MLTIAYLSAMQYYFKPVRKLPAGRGFADFVFVPKSEYAHDYPALVIELKLIGISYDKKTKEHQCVIEKYEK